MLKVLYSVFRTFPRYVALVLAAKGLGKNADGALDKRQGSIGEYVIVRVMKDSWS